MANGLLSPAEKQTQSVFGMVPMEERLSLLPRYSKTQGLIAPQFIYDLAKAVSTPIVAMRGEQVSPEEMLNVPLSGFIGSSFGNVPTGSLRSGIGKDALKVFHGGASKVVYPDLKRSGSVSGLLDEGQAFWVTPSKTSALRFGGLASETPVISEFNFSPKNPLIIEYPVKSIIDGSFAKIKVDSLNKARKAGNDSVVFKQSGGGEKLLDDEIAILNPRAIVGVDKTTK